MHRICSIINIIISLKKSVHCVCACTVAVGSPGPWKLLHALPLLPSCVAEKRQPQNRGEAFDITSFLLTDPPASKHAQVSPNSGGENEQNPKLSFMDGRLIIAV